MRLYPKHRDLSEPLERVALEVRASDFQIRPDEVHMRLDAFLHHHLHWRSRTAVQKLIHDGYVAVDLARRRGTLLFVGVNARSRRLRRPSRQSPAMNGSPRSCARRTRNCCVERRRNTSSASRRIRRIGG